MKLLLLSLTIALVSAGPQVQIGLKNDLSKDKEVGCEQIYNERKVCSKANVTWDTECELLLHRSACAEDDTKCVADHKVDYFGDCEEYPIRGIILGIYNQKDGELTKTEVAEEILAPYKKDKEDDDKYERLKRNVKKTLKAGKAMLMYDVLDDYDIVAIVGLGPKDVGVDKNENLNKTREAVREAVAAGAKALVAAGCVEIAVDPCSDPEAAAEAAHLATQNFSGKKTQKPRPTFVKVLSYGGDENKKLVTQGLLKASGQSLAAYLTDMPANFMTPTIFAKKAQQLLEPLGVKVEAHDQHWAKQQDMGAFLSVARGAGEPPVFLEITYKGGKEGEAPIALVGKGITFDAGGLALKNTNGMKDMRVDMAGGAVVVATIRTLAQLKVKLNLKGFVPLTENMPSGSSTKPSDVVRAKNGKTIEVKNPDAEGRLILADALTYAETFSPLMTIAMATMSGATRRALHPVAAALYTKQEWLWEGLKHAGCESGDRVWRMPSWELYEENVKSCHLADVCNIVKSSDASANIAAAFLKQFISPEANFAYLDIASVANNGESKSPSFATKGGVSGRPTRALIQYLMTVASGDAPGQQPKVVRK